MTLIKDKVPLKYDYVGKYKLLQFTLPQRDPMIRVSSLNPSSQVQE